MKKENDAARALQGYILPEAQHRQLELLRDHLCAMVGFVFASTQEEDDKLLQIKRSMLGQLFEGFYLQLDQAMAMLTKMPHHPPHTSG